MNHAYIFSILNLNSISDSASIDAIRVDDHSHDATYDLNGQTVTDDVNTPPSGIYIKRHNGAVSKIILPFR